MSGTHGSGAVFFSHCTLQCVFCQNRAISRRTAAGVELSIPELADTFLSLQEQGVHNINLVTPTQYAPQIVDALLLAQKNGLRLPILCNCGGYETVETVQLLSRVTTIWLPDFKYYSSYYAARFSGAEDYFETATAAIREMVRQSGNPRYDAAGMLTSGVLVRHLMLPGLGGDTAQVLRYLAETYGDRILVSLMRQYTPIEMDAYPELNGKISDAEYAEALELFTQYGLQGFLQEKEAVGESFVPEWNFRPR